MKRRAFLVVPALLVLFTLLPLVVSAGEITTAIPFSQDDVLFRKVDVYDRVELSGGILPEAEPGTPLLPARFINVLLPPDAEFIGVRAAGTEILLAEDILVFPAQPAQSPSLPTKPFVPPLPSAYEQTKIIPEALAVPAGVHRMRGQIFVAVRLNPVRYLPAEGKLYLNTAITLTVEYKTEDGTARRRKSLSDDAGRGLFTDMVNRLVVNPGVPIEKREMGIGTGAVKYVIVTTQALTPAFQRLADHREGLFGAGRTDVADLETILSGTPGVDNPDKIRNYIKKLVVDNGTDYVVLGGDDTVVPVRGCWVADQPYDPNDPPDGDDIEENMPTDLYYSGLDGNWDANGNRIYGEPEDNADMAPDVIVGRIPVRTAGEATAYIDKLIAYEALGQNDPLAGKLLLSGTESWNSWPAQVFNERGEVLFVERGEDSVYDGYAQFREHEPVSDGEQWARRIYRDKIRTHWPPGEIGMFFDTLTTWDDSTAGDYDQTAARLIEKYNLGWDHHFFTTHGNTNLYAIENEELFRVDDALEITAMVRFIATDACLTGHFDGDDDPCLSEAFLRNPNGGALVYLGCSRYGFGYPDDKNYGGPSGVYAAAYYARAFDKGVSGNTHGSAFALSKSDQIGRCAENGTYRWIQFGLNFQGDPAIRVRMSSFPVSPMLTSVEEIAGPAIRVAWEDLSDDETGFDIHRFESGGEWSALDSVQAGVTSYTDSTVAAQSFYAYRVSAVNAAGNSILSNEDGLVAGISLPDAWDPADDTAGGATPLTDLQEDYQSHGPHTLSSGDTSDWFSIDMQKGYAYYLSAYDEEAVGGVYAQLYSDPAGQHLVAEDGDLSGSEQFSLDVTPERTGTHYLRLRPNNELKSALYSLYYSMEADASSSESLGNALDLPLLDWHATSLTWQTSTGDPWYAQTETAHDGNGAVQSGNAYYDETSWIKTTIRRSGTVGFWWKVSSQENRDYLTFYINGEKIRAISGERDWHYINHHVDNGSELKWEFSRNMGSEGQDAGWLDGFFFNEEGGK